MSGIIESMKNMKEVDIDKLIQYLENEKKDGATKVQYVGTLMCKETGNTIVLTTEEQI